MGNREAIKTVVSEGLTRDIPHGIDRDAALPRLANRASVIKGVRRCGKTYRMFQRMNELLSNGVPRQHMLFIDFEDDRLMGVSDNVIGDAVEEYLRLTPYSSDTKLYLFFDEVQNVDGWGRPLRRLTQDPKFELCVSGSSAKMLSEDVATEFRGRSVSTEMYPLSFTEFLRMRKIEPSTIVSPDESRQLAKAFESYLDIGGFPEVQFADTATRVSVLQGIGWTVASRDLAERHNLPMLGARRFIQRAMRLSGREFSVNRIYNDLHSMKIPFSKEEAYAMPAHCEDAYLFFLISRFGADMDESQRGKRKLYAIDPGIQFAFGPSSSLDLGQRLEDAVYIELRRRRGGDKLSSIGFYRTGSGYEVDFALGDEDAREITSLYQVSVDVDDPKTYTRETRALTEALDETGLPEGLLLVMDASGVPTPQDKRIHVVSAWEWMLKNPMR